MQKVQGLDNSSVKAGAGADVNDANKRLADVLSRALAMSQERQNNVNELSHYLEMKWVNDANPEVQAARMMPGTGKEKGKISVETESHGLVLNALEYLISDVMNMSQSIENRLLRDAQDVESLSSRVNLLNARIRSTAERKVKKKTGISQSQKRRAKSSSMSSTTTTAVQKPHEPKLLPLWTPQETPKLSTKGSVFHRKALVSRLVTGLYYEELNKKNDAAHAEENKEMEEEIKEAEEEIRRESQLSEALEMMALEAREAAEKVDEATPEPISR